jgi:bis(5'-nucleosyl)-tetraphosphatase (symmetrical)
MATYAIGDIQGCHEALDRLLDAIRFDPAADRLWLVGDLVNRGPNSLATLRFVRSLGSGATTILGNHDLHLITVAAGYAKLHRGDTLDEVLAAPDCDELLGWLRQQKLMHVEDGIAMVHAGLLPQWTVEQALALAREFEAALRSPEYRDLLSTMYGNRPDAWSDDLVGADRLRVIVNAMTRMRLCTDDGRMEFTHKGSADNLPAGFVPWFNVAERRSRDSLVIFGHWSALGLFPTTNVIGLDSGCLWGGALSALRLEDRQIFQVRCPALADPAGPQ